VLQFLPVVGPSVLVGALVVYQLLAGDAAAALVGVAGVVGKGTDTEIVGYCPPSCVGSPDDGLGRWLWNQ
jgi:hypothetical protein